MLSHNAIKIAALTNSPTHAHITNRPKNLPYNAPSPRYPKPTTNRTQTANYFFSGK